MNNVFSSINNKELEELLNYVTEQSMFFSDGMRLLSKDEIKNYKEELNIEKDSIIPLIDLSDNNFLIYNIAKDSFECINIVDEVIFKSMTSIENYLELLRKN